MFWMARGDSPSIVAAAIQAAEEIENTMKPKPEILRPAFIDTSKAAAIHVREANQFRKSVI